MIDLNILKKYAKLALKMGVNIQEDEPLLINAPIEGAQFVRELVKQAYELGAKDVHVNWVDDELTLLRFTHVKEDVLKTYPKWRVDMQEAIVAGKGAVISIHATDPDLLKDIDPSRVALANKVAGEALTEYRQAMMNDEIKWTVISIPTVGWAKKVFPEQSETEAVASLWDAIVQTVRVDEVDPVQAWHDHNETLRQAHEYLNKKAYEKLVFKGPGTQLEVGLPKGHIWQGGSAIAKSGTSFNPNMPTEEVYTVPHKYAVNGMVTSTKPLNYGGSLIDDFTLTFKDGKVVDYTAEHGEDVLKHLLEADEGARYLGEVALVPDESPISKSGIVFYNTLFDENASCHVALGKAYPTSLQGGDKMSLAELDKHGVNDSVVHVDFMIGSDEMDIDGVMADGTAEPLFRNGSWAIKFK